MTRASHGGPQGIGDVVREIDARLSRGREGWEVGVICWDKKVSVITYAILRVSKQEYR